jgi:hypothetical protein
MSREHFYNDEAKELVRLLALKDLITEQELSDRPCHLMAMQLNELSVLCARLQVYIRKLSEAVADAGYRA